MEFSSRKDLWMGVIIWGCIGAFVWIFYQSLFVKFDILGLVIAASMICFSGSIWFNTKYKIEGGMLNIHFGPIKKTIVIQSIKSIRFAKNPFTSPALSIHKIEINYGKYETISISPKDTDRFIEILKKNNPQIKMK
ncbi:PH domain-containing protein [Siminovitchia fortis]|uniref:Uncharacterized protein YyaB-like PH domain-containing protein n=1 Tax=Siminovitchia fortis TaxID=254758 RepID=A0A451GCR1_9BACI|nr:PH domain-containing protein [Siminovitchia fortis]RWR13186.1 hypothetical protein D4N35_005290 [Siminovitchia fortis]WHY82031.1 PH domain-containing protein [Siminovitchia fortis]